MGQKVHPIGYRLGVVSDWQSKWYADKREYAKKLHEEKGRVITQEMFRIFRLFLGGCGGERNMVYYFHNFIWGVFSPPGRRIK